MVLQNKLLAGLFSTALLTNTVFADTTIIYGDKVFTSGPKGIITEGAVVVTDGKITAVGAAANMKLPPADKTYRAAVVTPGLIDSYTVVGANGAFNVDADQDATENTDANGSEYRILDSYNARETLVSYVRGYGVTTLNVSPGLAAPIAGSSALFKTKGTGADSDLLASDTAMIFNLGETPKSTFGSKGGPSTRMAVAAKIRGALLAAKAWASKDEDKRKPDLGMMALASVLSGERKAVFTARREDDIATALRIGREFGFTPVINFGTESYLMQDTIKENGATVIITPTMSRPLGLENENTTLEAAALLKAGGVPFVFSSGYEGYVPKSRVLLWEMAVSVANGLDAESTIKAATINPAILWGVSDKVGSLEAGKDADLLMFDGDPFEYTSHILGTMIDGKFLDIGAK